MKLLGTIEQAGPWLALRTSPTCVYPLGGASGIADDFREAFGDPQAHDVGKRVFRHSAGHLCMENDAQRDTRLASDPDINPDWKPRVAYREMVRGGDAWAHDHSPETLLDAAKAILSWELEQ
jgi:hypothetical protein